MQLLQQYKYLIEPPPPPPEVYVFTCTPEGSRAPLPSPARHNEAPAFNGGQQPHIWVERSERLRGDLAWHDDSKQKKESGKCSRVPGPEILCMYVPSPF